MGGASDNWSYCQVAADPSPPLQVGSPRVAPFRRSALWVAGKGGAGPLLRARRGLRRRAPSRAPLHRALLIQYANYPKHRPAGLCLCCGFAAAAGPERPAGGPRRHAPPRPSSSLGFGCRAKVPPSARGQGIADVMPLALGTLAFLRHSLGGPGAGKGPPPFVTALEVWRRLAWPSSCRAPPVYEGAHHAAVPISVLWDACDLGSPRVCAGPER
jgi:hypothetical protein